MNKRYLHHVWTQLRAVKPWYFLAVAVISTVVCVFALRANNEHMVKLRSAVYAADKNNGDVNGALHNLQAYVTAHMNTNLSSGPNAAYPPIQLEYTYERLVQAQEKSQNGDQLYTEAQKYCEQQDPVDFSGHNRVPCIEQYVQSHGGTQTPANIPDALYKFSFLSPRWSPDLAGWSLLAAALSWLLFIIAFALNRWLKHYSK
ncbi:MAG TPA: hypothetical protein VHC21_01150 [Candidatus Saccharimonadales bacterium]|nr:hypothetical protein [Candidatus Saccharimonadales bacterium]